MNVTLYPTSTLKGKIFVPGDKSISHRALIFGALSEGTTEISGLLKSEDVMSTSQCLNQLGIEITHSNLNSRVKGKNLNHWSAPLSPLDCGNSGTTCRLLMGALAGSSFTSLLIGDSSLSSRPMKRIIDPLVQMGVRFDTLSQASLPVRLTGNENLKPLFYDLPIPSAQIKGALLLAGLNAHGKTRLQGRLSSRDHTERLLPEFGAKLEASPSEISIEGRQSLFGAKIRVPGDFSSAAYWLVAAAIAPQSKLVIESVSLNPTRIGLIHVLRRMGARIQCEITEHSPEPIGRIEVESSPLLGTEISPEEVPSLIDELPLIAVAAAFSEGRTSVKGAGELRVKETDRIAALEKNMRAVGVKMETSSDGFTIEGPQIPKGGVIDSFQDHRIAMAFAVAALRSNGPTEIIQSECVAISYPNFFETLQSLTKFRTV